MAVPRRRNNDTRIIGRSRLFVGDLSAWSELLFDSMTIQMLILLVLGREMKTFAPWQRGLIELGVLCTSLGIYEGYVDAH